MTEYHKIQTVFQRDPDNLKALLIGVWTYPEFEYLADNVWEFTEKVDGTNIRVNIEPTLQTTLQMVGQTHSEHATHIPAQPQRRVWFGGKTDGASIPAFLVRKLEERFLPQHEDLLNLFPFGATLYGEGYGAKIQKGGNYRQDQDFVLFDALVTAEDGRQWWLERKNVEDVGTNLSLDVVPVIGRGTLHEMIAQARAGISSRWGNFMAEGIVARPATELRTRAGQRIITKIKSRDFQWTIG